MGQLGKTFEDLNQELKDLGKDNLQDCYSPDEILEIVSEDLSLS